MDITKKSVVTTVEWFHGYGGNALGLRRAIPGLRSVAVCERDAFVVANMVSKMEKGLLDAVPIWTDVTDFPTEPFGRGALDLFIASYPCQGFSHAGKRLGVEDHRHLWPYCRKFIGAVRPRYVWLENVEGHVTLGLSTVLADLEDDGYQAAWGIFSASEVGAPHQRKRVFILAYDRLQRQALDEQQTAGVVKCSTENELALRHGIGCPHRKSEEQSAERGVDAQRDFSTSGGEDVAHQQQQGLQGYTGDVNGEGREPGGAAGPVTEGGVSIGETRWPSRPGERQYVWEPPRVVVGNSRNERSGGAEGYGSGGEEGQSKGHPAESVGSAPQRSQTQPPMGGNADGLAAGMDFPRCPGLSDTELAEIHEWMVKGTNRTDELRMCGNGVVPQTAERAFRVLYRELTGKEI